MLTARGARANRPEADPVEQGAARKAPGDTVESRRDTTLVVTDGEWMGRRVRLRDAPVIVGRGIDADLQIRDPTVSRHHCVFWRVAGRFWVRDLGSMNHTRVNNRFASITELFVGDVVVVGQTALTLTPDEQTEDAAQASE
jgi:pSer/pThr/pTyr-binding forkhead associated (FHA) protein